MASPNFDALSVRFSRMINDSVATASTSGDQVTSAERSAILNSAIRRFIQKRIQIVDAGNLSVRILDPLALRGYIVSKAKALAANVQSLTAWDTGADVDWIISMFNDTLDIVVAPLQQELKSIALSDVPTFITPSVTNQFYLIEGTNIRVLGSGATDSILLEFIKAHVDLSAGGSTDITIPAQYWEELLNEALNVYSAEYSHTA